MRVPRRLGVRRASRDQANPRHNRRQRRPSEGERPSGDQDNRSRAAIRRRSMAELNDEDQFDQGMLPPKVLALLGDPSLNEKSRNALPRRAQINAKSIRLLGEPAMMIQSEKAKRILGLSDTGANIPDFDRSTRRASLDATSRAEGRRPSQSSQTSILDDAMIQVGGSASFWGTHEVSTPHPPNSSTTTNTTTLAQQAGSLLRRFSRNSFSRGQTPPGPSASVKPTHQQSVSPPDRREHTK